MRNLGKIADSLTPTPRCTLSTPPTPTPIRIARERAAEDAFADTAPPNSPIADVSGKARVTHVVAS